MRTLEDLSNWFSDIDWTWWPLLSLRPPKNENISNRALFKITSFFGPGAGVVSACALQALDIFGVVPAVGIKDLAFVAVLTCVLFFLFAKHIAVRSWNKRAARF
ncbi:MAG: hypothetical protein JWM16_2961 [Verrucomicrobiales bacterium]|nr:hypothetical protein [Verrucomicrobiales bacterium]